MATANSLIWVKGGSFAMSCQLAYAIQHTTALLLTEVGCTEMYVNQSKGDTAPPRLKN